MKHLLTALLFCSLTACGHAASQPVQREGDATGYQSYTDGVLGNAESAVLFFTSPDCASCTQHDAELRAWYAVTEFPVMTYVVNREKEPDIAERYNVMNDDTFVLIDANGMAMATEVMPSQMRLKRLLYANIEAAKAMDSGGGSASISTPSSAGTYSTYTDAVIGNGQESVLFFHAAWCPYCIANNTRLETWYAGGGVSHSVYRIDFDTAADVKQQYGVTQQDTFILIDGTGKEIRRISFPSEADLRSLVGA